MREAGLGFDGRRSSRNAGHDGEHVAGPHRRSGRCQMPDVGLIEIEADKVPQSAILLQQMALEPVVGSQQAIQHLAHGVTRELNAILAGSEASEGSGNGNGYGHWIIPRSRPRVTLGASPSSLPPEPNW